VTSALSLVYQHLWVTLPPGCDQISCSPTPARLSCFGVPLHVVKVSYRAHRFESDLTWSILCQQFVIWVPRLMLDFPDAHMFWSRRRLVLLLCDSSLYRCLPLTVYKSLIRSCHRCLAGRTTATRSCPAWLTASSVVCRPSSIRLQGRSLICGCRTTQRLQP